MARVVCINPCLIDAGVTMALPSMRIPTSPATTVKPVLDLNFKGGCDGCELLTNFMIQIQPYLISLQIPLCLLRCMLSVFSAGQPSGDPAHPSNMGLLDEIVGALGNLPNPNLTKVTQSTSYATLTCAECFLVTPCKFACLLEDLLTAVLSVINCVISLINNLTTLNLKATGLSLNDNVSVQETAQCLFGLIGVQKQNLGVKFNLIGAILSAIGFIAQFANITLPPTSITVTVNTPLSDISDALSALVPSLTSAKNDCHAACC
jgi:hypothetical protein